MMKNQLVSRRNLLATGASALVFNTYALAGQTYQSPGIYIEETNMVPWQIPSGETLTCVFIGPFFDREMPSLLVTSSLELESRTAATHRAQYKELFDCVRQYFGHGGRRAILVNQDVTGAAGLAEPLSIADDLQFSLLCVPLAHHLYPGQTGLLRQIYANALTACEAQRAMLLVDGPSPAQAAAWKSSIVLHSPDIAAYAPLLIQPGSSSAPMTSLGAVAGVFNRMDQARGVWKAPAGAEAALQVAPANAFSTNQTEHLTDHNINMIKAFAGKGTMIWGARTLEISGGAYKYIPVRRLLQHIVKNIELAGADRAFTQNDQATWDNVKMGIGNYFHTLWRDGALAGAKPSQAYFVRCGVGETMSAADIAAGELIVELGVALLRPAEFITEQIKFQI